MPILFVIPKSFLSLIMGLIARIYIPKFLRPLVIGKFIKMYKINTAEAEKDYTEYSSLSDFFIRKLKPGIRPVADSWAVAPADSELTMQGRISQNQIIYAKGMSFTLKEFLYDNEASGKFGNGQFYTYYLCPADYHRVHSPVSGIIKRVVHVPGKLWPVNNWAVKNIQKLFAVNERVIVEIETNLGPVAVVFVAATNVGQIELAFDQSLKTNQFLQSKEPRVLTYSEKKEIKKGDELGLFKMGSTIIVVYPHVIVGNLKLPQIVKVNTSLF